MNSFEKAIKEQLISYQRQIEGYEALGNMEMVRIIRAQVAGYKLGLATCLNPNYVATFFENIENCY